MDLVEWHDGGEHGLRNFSHQYRCPACNLMTGGRMPLLAEQLRCRCGAILVEVNSDCQHERVRPMVKAGRYQCRACSRILIPRP